MENEHKEQMEKYRVTFTSFNRRKVNADDDHGDTVDIPPLPSTGTATVNPTEENVFEI
jgi:hypothetical protein